ncbi:GDSL esterase/lipase At4g16230-like [Tasmannia lanceolata]|uniref:GDSL esterase/lipase At4g16230-like n=1 Tax=Tasmannia lanceolata TaxID=3420 RepID=UPI004062CBA4
MANTFSSFVLITFCLLSLLFLSECSEDGKINGMFVFGSSIVDNGNNNFVMNTSAKANYFPYGIDFVGPSGRFSNGRNPVDVLGQLLKLPPLLPVFRDPWTRRIRILHGVNYASGGSGILDQTGTIAGNVTSLSQQIRNLEEVTLPDLGAQLGQKLSSHIAGHLFVLGTGGNDYLLNYFLPSTTPKISLQDFTRTLIVTFSKQLKRLYGLGGRKFVLLSVQALGCVPVVRNRPGASGNCIEAINDAALLFNSYLKILVDEIKPEMPGSNLVLVNCYKIIKDIVDNPSPTGFEETGKPCCEVSLSSGNGILCTRGGSTCIDRRAHVFFDGLHPTDAINALIAEKAYASNLTTEVYPINVQQLVAL